LISYNCDRVMLLQRTELLKRNRFARRENNRFAIGVIFYVLLIDRVWRIITFSNVCEQRRRGGRLEPEKTDCRTNKDFERNNRPGHVAEENTRRRTTKSAFTGTNVYRCGVCARRRFRDDRFREYLRRTVFETSS